MEEREIKIAIIALRESGLKSSSLSRELAQRLIDIYEISGDERAVKFWKNYKC